MSYLKFDKRLMANLNESTERELLRTNRMGAYSNTTLVGCNTRKYHGLLVVPLPELSPNNHILLSSLDLTIIQHNAPFNIGLHEYDGDVFSPMGHKYIREFNMDVTSTTTYRVGGVILRREQLFCHFEHRLILKYTLIDAHSETELRFSPFLAFRDVKILSHKNDNIEREFFAVKGGIRIRLYPEYPYLYMQFNDDVEFVSDPNWYENIEYIKERERGYEYTEDQYVPGYFSCKITKDKPLYFTAGLGEIDPAELEDLFNKEKESRIPKTDFKHCLNNAAHQFYYRPNPNDGYLLAGYPWFAVRTRDMLVALPGCTLHAADAQAKFDRIMHTITPLLDNFMNQKYITHEIRNINDPDIGLWYIWVVQQYAQWANIDKARSEYGDAVIRVVEYYLKNIHPNVRMMENGLLYAFGDGKPLTWMDAKINGQAVVPREGYIVEVNALWYNAISFLMELFPNYRTDYMQQLQEQIGVSFTKTFMNQYHYLFDYVKEGVAQDWSVRPNMIFAISLPYSPLTRREQRDVLEIITRELRTPKGLRSLSPKSEGFKGVCGPTQYEREISYYNGSVWPWLLGAYCEAYLKIHKRGGISFVERILIGMEEELQLHGVGTISELFDGNPPYKGRGAISFAMSVGEINRALYLLNKAKEEDNDFNTIIRYI